MRAYISAFKASFMTLIQYRIAALSGCVTQLFFGFVKILVFQAFYASTVQAQPLSFNQMVSYIWLGQALFVIIPLQEDYNFTNLIRTGNIVYELIRPVNIFGFWFSKQIAQRVVPTVLRCIPLIFVTIIIFPLIGFEQWALQVPPSLTALFLFFISMIFAVLLTTAFSLLLSTSLFWTISSNGITSLLPVVIWSFSGILIPISFFPVWAQPIVRHLPFRGIMDIPFQIYIGSVQGLDVLKEIGLQFFWVVVLLILIRTLLGLGLKRVVVQGG
jgi:ABC-2 type transport system permease protein